MFKVWLVLLVIVLIGSSLLWVLTLFCVFYCLIVGRFGFMCVCMFVCVLCVLCVLVCVCVCVCVPYTGCFFVPQGPHQAQGP